MRKWLQIALAALLVAIAGVVALLVFRPQEREPVYQGKRLSSWLREADMGRSFWLPETTAERNGRAGAMEAVRQVGTNGIPVLLNMLRRSDSPSVTRLTALWKRVILRIPYLPSWAEYPSWYKNRAKFIHLDALSGFEILGADAEQAVPELIKIWEQHISNDSQFSTGMALIGIGPQSARRTIPLFLRDAASSNAAVRHNAISALSYVHIEATQVVPALEKYLGDADFNMRLWAAKGLGNFGPNAQQAIPALLPLLSDPDGAVRFTATNALKQIDPEAAAKAGVK